MSQSEHQKEIQRQWVANLRSGGYKQGKDRLHIIRENGQHEYCCLGVLCDMAVKAGVIKETAVGQIVHLVSVSYTGTGDRPDSSYLPYDVQVWAGVKRLGNLNKKHDGALTTLATLNDAGSSFEEIAALIESGDLEQL